jgi:chromosome segregation ATPase
MDDTSGMTADGETLPAASSVASSQGVEAALERLARAVNRLDAAVQRRLAADMSLNGLQEELQRLGEDRSSLAATLDTAEARVARLEDANREVSRRLVSAMESIRSVLETHGG